jgi:mono/diheme cytochrome c family protein
MRSSAWLHWLAVAASIAPAVWSSVPGPAPQDAGRTGQQLYRTYCASCHGTAGRGNGPVASHLNVPPANLTMIAARNRGVFPTELVEQIVEGRRSVKTHGDSAMPIWGDVFSLSGSADGDIATAEKIRRLVAYVESIQQRPGE